MTETSLPSRKIKLRKKVGTPYVSTPSFGKTYIIDITKKISQLSQITHYLMQRQKPSPTNKKQKYRSTRMSYIKATHN